MGIRETNLPYQQPLKSHLYISKQQQMTQSRMDTYIYTATNLKP